MAKGKKKRKDEEGYKKKDKMTKFASLGYGFAKVMGSDSFSMSNFGSPFKGSSKAKFIPSIFDKSDSKTTSSKTDSAPSKPVVQPKPKPDPKPTPSKDQSKPKAEYQSFQAWTMAQEKAGVRFKSREEHQKAYDAYVHDYKSSNGGERMKLEEQSQKKKKKP
jgi:hypothetical protein